MPVFSPIRSPLLLRQFLAWTSCQLPVLFGKCELSDKLPYVGKTGASIPELYAAGEVTGGVHGGNAVADIITFGRIAGTNAAAYAKAH